MGMAVGLLRGGSGGGATPPEVARANGFRAQPPSSEALRERSGEVEPELLPPTTATFFAACNFSMATSAFGRRLEKSQAVCFTKPGDTRDCYEFFYHKARCPRKTTCHVGPFLLCRLSSHKSLGVLHTGQL